VDLKIVWFVYVASCVKCLVTYLYSILSDVGIVQMPNVKSREDPSDGSHPDTEWQS